MRVNCISFGLGIGLMVSTSACFQSTELKFNDQNAAVASGRIPASVAEDYSLELPIGNRHYVFSVLSQVFAIPEVSGDADALRTDIFFKKEFGGGCDLYGVSEITVNGTVTSEFASSRCIQGITSDLKATSNPMRYAWTAKTCESLIVSKPTRYAAAMNQILTGWSVGSSQVQHRPSPDTVKKAYGLFFQGRDPDADEVAALLQLGATASNNDDAWRLILISLCVNPEWQSLI